MNINFFLKFLVDFMHNSLCRYVSFLRYGQLKIYIFTPVHEYCLKTVVDKAKRLTFSYFNFSNHIVYNKNAGIILSNTLLDTDRKYKIGKPFCFIFNHFALSSHPPPPSLDAPHTLQNI